MLHQVARIRLVVKRTRQPLQMGVQLMPQAPSDSFARLGRPASANIGKQPVQGVTADDRQRRRHERPGQRGPRPAEGVERAFQHVGHAQQKDGPHPHRGDGRGIPAPPTGGQAPQHPAPPACLAGFDSLHRPISRR